MEPIILNQSFEQIGIVDEYESFIWTDRYSAYGDFEIYAYPTSKMLEIGKRNNYVYLPESEHMMIIESINTKSDVDSGTRLILSGRSLESILDRRIVWNQTTVSGTVDNCVKSLLTKNIIDPDDANRKISNFIFKAATDSLITGTTMKAQYTGDNIYDVVTEICNELSIGFKVTLNGSNKFVFQMYNGKDRSYNQSTNPYVIFSPEFENIINSSYLESAMNWKNCALVLGEDQGNARKRSIVNTSKSGLTRRELYVDARDIRSTDEQGAAIPNYTDLLQKRGKEQMTEYTKDYAFEGEVETISTTFVYNTDYFLGDVVQVADAFGYGDAVRVTEVVYSQDENGISIVPTFTMHDDNDA